jgi:hypothetical protein
MTSILLLLPPFLGLNSLLSTQIKDFYVHVSKITKPFKISEYFKFSTPESFYPYLGLIQSQSIPLKLFKSKKKIVPEKCRLFSGKIQVKILTCVSYRSQTLLEFINETWERLSEARVDFEEI